MIEHVAIRTYSKGLVCDPLRLAKGSDLDIVVIALMKPILHHERTGVNPGVMLVESEDPFEIGIVDVAETECPDATMPDMSTQALPCNGVVVRRRIYIV